MPRIEDEHSLVFALASKHLAIGAPTNGRTIVGHVREGNLCIIAPILVNIPDFNRLINRVCRKEVLGGSVPLDTDALAGVSLELQIAIRAILSIHDALVVVEDPELGLAIIGTSGKKPILEGRPLHVEDVARVTLDQWRPRIETNWLVSVENRHGRGGAPGYGDHSTIGGHAIVLIRVTSCHSIERGQRCERQVLERLSKRTVCFFNHFLTSGYKISEVFIFN